MKKYQDTTIIWWLTLIENAKKKFMKMRPNKILQEFTRIKMEIYSAFVNRSMTTLGKTILY